MKYQTMSLSNNQKIEKPERKKVCFVMGVGQRYKLMYRVADEMIRRFSIEPRYLVVNRGMRDYLLAKKVPPNTIINLNKKTSFGSWGNEPVDHGFLTEMEARFGIPNLYLYWESVRNYQGYDHYSAMKMLETVFKQYLVFLEKALLHVYVFAHELLLLPLYLHYQAILE